MAGTSNKQAAQAVMVLGLFGAGMMILGFVGLVVAVALP